MCGNLILPATIDYVYFYMNLNLRNLLYVIFACEDELTETTARLKELNILLNMDEKDKMLIDEAPDEGEEPPVRKVVGLER